jgi:murein DD-endopeptidase MepM/ murein hydrolase activator NlpD
MKRNLFILLVFITLGAIGQSPYPTEAFRSPLDIPLILAGTFGELRSNHFHSGIDIKTQQRQGLPIYAIGDGTVTRIKISLWGYGKALYVAHPNGYTSVYAHLQKFSPEIEAYIKQVQYKKQAYEVEVFPDYGELQVTKGNTIAYTGNSGGSSGPHLHFEIRSSLTEKPTNPLLYGLEVRDATNPVINAVYAYPLSGNSHVNRSTEKVQINISKQKDGSYIADKVYALGTIGFGVNAFDRQDLAANKNGVYSIKQLVNSKVYTDIDFETFSFSETRYINTYIDYEHFGKSRQRIQQCFRTPGNKLDIYNTIYNDGKIEVRPGLTYHVEIQIIDVAGNEVKIFIPVQGRREPAKYEVDDDKTDNFVIAKKPNNYDLGGAKVYFPANTFYEDFYIHLKKGKDTVTIHNNSVPAHKNFTISFNTDSFSNDERKQLFIARLNRKLEPSYMNTYKRGTTFTTRTRNLGTYTLAKDSIAPKIWAKNFKEKQWLTNYRYLSLHISDDLSGVDTYSATLNGEWILMEYEPKTNTITYNFDDIILDKNQCELQVIVTDNVGNSTTFNSSFYRK